MCCVMTTVDHVNPLSFLLLFCGRSRCVWMETKEREQHHTLLLPIVCLLLVVVGRGGGSSSSNSHFKLFLNTINVVVLSMFTVVVRWWATRANRAPTHLRTKVDSFHYPLDLVFVIYSFVSFIWFNQMFIFIILSSLKTGRRQVKWEEVVVLILVVVEVRRLQATAPLRPWLPSSRSSCGKSFYFSKWIKTCIIMYCIIFLSCCPKFSNCINTLLHD